MEVLFYLLHIRYNEFEKSIYTSMKNIEINMRMENDGDLDKRVNGVSDYA